MKKMFLLLLSITMLFNSLCFVSCKKNCGHSVFLHEIVKNATCIEEGEQKVICKDCGYFYLEEMAKTAHQWGEYTITKEATFYETGEKVKACKICNTVMNVEINKLDRVLPSTPLTVSENGTTLKILELSCRYDFGRKIHILEYKCKIISMNGGGYIRYKAYNEENTVIDSGYGYVSFTKYSAGDVFTDEIYTNLGFSQRFIIKIN